MVKVKYLDDVGVSHVSKNFNLPAKSLSFRSHTFMIVLKAFKVGFGYDLKGYLTIQTALICKVNFPLSASGDMRNNLPFLVNKQSFFKNSFFGFIYHGMTPCHKHIFK